MYCLKDIALVYCKAIQTSSVLLTKRFSKSLNLLSLVFRYCYSRDLFKCVHTSDYNYSTQNRQLNQSMQMNCFFPKSTFLVF